MSAIATTFAVSKAWLRKWWLPLVIALLTIGNIVLFSLLLPALGKISDQAQQGQDAKDTQCDLRPVSVKLYRGAARYQIITPEDLAKYLANGPECPPPPKRTKR